MNQYINNAVPSTEILGETCIDGGTCHHACTDKCFRRECCAPLSGYTGPWAIEPVDTSPIALIAWIKDAQRLMRATADTGWHAKANEGSAFIERLSSAPPPELPRMTAAQKRFLKSYLPDVLHDEQAKLKEASLQDFVQAVTGLDFDGGVLPGECRVARALNEKGLFTEFELRPSVHGQYLYLSFSALGAQALFSLMNA